jgi:hypothetical protein
MQQVELAILIVFLPIMMLNLRNVGKYGDSLPWSIFWATYFVIYFHNIFALI